MPGVNSKYFGLGEETAWGTAVAATRSFEIRNDDFVQVFSPEEVGETTYASQEGELPHNSAMTLEKVTGSIDAAFYRHGQGLLLKGLLGAATTPAAVTGSTNARHTRTYTTTPDGPTNSYTGRVGRSRRVSDLSSEEVEEFVYTGLVIGGWEIKAERGSPLSLMVNFVGKEETPGGAAVAQTYPALTDAGFFQSSNAGLSVAGVAVDEFSGLTITADYKLNDAKKTLNSDANIIRPIRQGIPEVSVSLSGGIYSSDVATDLYAKLRSGEGVAVSLTCKQRPAGYTANPPLDHSLDILTINLGNVFLTGGNPTGAPGSPVAIDLEGKAQWGGAPTDHLVEIVLQNSETTDA